MRVERVDELQLLVQVAAVHLDVARLVDDLGGRVELGVDVGHGLHDLGRADERTLFAVHELAEPPRLDMAAEFPLALVGHLVPPLGAEDGEDLVGHADGIAQVDLLAPVEAVAADPLAPRPLVVQAQQLVAAAGVVEVEHRGGWGLDTPLRLEGEIRLGRRARGHGTPFGSCSDARATLPARAAEDLFDATFIRAGRPNRPPDRCRGGAPVVAIQSGAIQSGTKRQRQDPGEAQRKSNATLMAPLCSWVANATNASRHWASRKMWVSMPVMSMRPCSARRR